MGDATAAVPSQEEPSANRRGAMRESLAAVAGNVQIRRVQLAFLGSSIGDWAYATAIIVWAYDTGGAEAVGIWMSIRLVLGALTSPLLATFADRWPRRRVMILTDVLRAAIVAVAAVLIHLDTAPILVFVLATAASLASSPFLVAQRALLPSLARTPTELTAANGVHSTIDSLAFFAGPALAAGLLAVSDVSAVLVLDVATFLWSLLLVSRVRVPAHGDRDPGAAESSEDGRAQEGLLTETLAGFRLIGSDRTLTLAVVQASLQTVIAGAFTVFLVVMADELLGSPDSGLGVLNSIVGVGAVLGGVLAIARAGKGTLGRDLTLGVLLWSAPLLLVTASPTVVACVVAVAVLGLANPLVDVNLDTILQRVTPDAMLGRVFGALESCAIGAAAIGAVAMPFLLDWFGLRLALAVLAVPVALLSLLGLPAMVRLDVRLAAPRGLALLRGADLFAPLDAPTLEQLAQRLTEVRVTAGEVLLREGEPSDRFYLVETGLLSVTQHGRTLREEGPGEYVGEIGLLRDVPRTATVSAVEDTVLLALAREDFLGAVSGDAESRRVADKVIGMRLAA
jgi:MFS family permease